MKTTSHYQPRQLRGIEARACFLHAGQVAMAHYLVDGRELALQAQDEILHRLLLGWRASIRKMALSIQAALIADANGIGIVASGMGTHALQGTCGYHRAVSATVEMIADEAPMIHLHVVVIELLYCVVLIAAGSRAMHYDHVNLSHVCQNFQG